MTSGLVRRPHYEEILNAAVKGKTSQHGILSVPMQRAATKAINSPLLQRINPGIELEHQQKVVMEQQQFQHHVQNISVDARVSHEDLKWLVENLQPPAPPQPPPPPSQADSRADQEREWQPN